MTTRAVRSAALAALVIMALTGCARFLAETTVHDDDTFSGRVVFAFNDAVAQQFAGAAPGGLDGESPLGDPLAEIASSEEFLALQERYPGQVDVRDYVEGDREGVELTFDRVPLDEFNTTVGEFSALAGPSAAIVREGDTFVVTLDAADAGDVDDLGGLGGPALPGGDIGLLESAIDFDIIYRFPGLVREASAGTVDGNRVTLGLSDVLDSGEIRIVAGADPEINWAPILRWGLVALAFVVIVGGAAALVIQDKRKRSQTGLPPPRTTTPG